MEDLKIFENASLSKTEQLANLGVASLFLYEALECGTKKEAWEIMSLVSKIYHPLGCKAFNTLYGVVAMDITRSFSKNEFYWQNLFKKNIDKIMPNAKIVNKKSNGRDIPDAWVLNNNELIPVEVKLHKFNNKAKQQLLRYMKSYNCNHGIAVGEELSTELPNNIVFYSLDSIK